MEDDQLDTHIAFAEVGYEHAAAGALIEIVQRIVNNRQLTSRSIITLCDFARRTVLAKNALTFFSSTKPPRKGRPTRLNPLFEALVFAQTRKEGFTLTSPDRDVSGKRSAFTETARRLGATDENLEREANRIAKAYKRWKRRGTDGSR
jgi:hypothetical protein